jgi:hypothetical protein
MRYGKTGIGVEIKGAGIGGFRCEKVCFRCFLCRIARCTENKHGKESKNVLKRFEKT